MKSSDADLSEFGGRFTRNSADADRGIEYRLLGPLEILRDGFDHAPTRPKMLQLLALFLLRPGRIVHNDTIVRELWDDAPPRSVRTTMHTYVYHLRRCLERLSGTNNGDDLLVTKPPGYVLRIEPGQVDVCTFRGLCREGRRLLDGKQYRETAARFRSAIDLWTGPPLGNVHCGPILSGYVIELGEQLRTARHLRIEAEIRAGLHHSLIGELRSLVTANPLDECLHGQLMRVLGLSGRRPDAMASYRQLRSRLHDELGIEPCDELQSLHRDLLVDGELHR